MVVVVDGDGDFKVLFFLVGPSGMAAANSQPISSIACQG